MFLDRRIMSQMYIFALKTGDLLAPFSLGFCDVLNSVPLSLPAHFFALLQEMKPKRNAIIADFRFDDSPVCYWKTSCESARLQCVSHF